MNAIMILCDAAQAAGGKLYILGGGWSIITSAGPVPMSLAIKIDVPWNESDRDHSLTVKLLDPDGHLVTLPGPLGEPQHVQLGGTFRVDRPAPGAVASGSTLTAVLAINVEGIPLPPGRYIWDMEIDGERNEHWNAPFEVRTP